jgi:hypothetical protein
MLIRPVLIWRLVAPGLMLLWASGVEAQPAEGSLGEQSRASIEISVSVMPRFSLGQSSNVAPPVKAGGEDGQGAVQLFSNSSDLRIHLVGPSSSPAPDEARLFLIAAD